MRIGDLIAYFKERVNDASLKGFYFLGLAGTYVRSCGDRAWRYLKRLAPGAFRAFRNRVGLWVSRIPADSWWGLHLIKSVFGSKQGDLDVVKTTLEVKQLEREEAALKSTVVTEVSLADIERFSPKVGALFEKLRRSGNSILMVLWPVWALLGGVLSSISSFIGRFIEYFIGRFISIFRKRATQSSRLGRPPALAWV